MKDAIISLAFLTLPTIGLFCAWKYRTRQANQWRENLNLFALVALTGNLAYAAVFLLWPYFGAKLGSGVPRWELTSRLAELGFWLSVLSLGLSMLCRKQRLALGGLSFVAMAFWFTIQIPISDYLAVEGARQGAAHATMPNR